MKYRHAARITVGLHGVWPLIGASISADRGNLDAVP